MDNWQILKKGQSTDFAIIIGIVLLFLSIIAMNVNLIFNMTSNQTEEIGRMQLEEIRRELEDKIISSENAVVQLADEFENRRFNGITEAEIAILFAQKKRDMRALFNGVCFNVYMADKDISVIPDFKELKGYRAQERMWYTGAVANAGKIYITEPYIDAMTGVICFTMSKVLDDGHTVVSMDFTFADMQTSILKMTSGNNRTALIASKDGMIIGYTDMSLVGKEISQELPKYQPILERVIQNTNHNSFRAEMDGNEYTIFSSETNNGWYLIVRIDDWTFYSESYWQVIITVLISLGMLTVIVIFYLNSVKNRLRSEKALRAKEEFLSNLSQELRDPLKKILTLSKSETAESTEDSAEMAAQVQESALRLSDMLDNLFSFSTLIDEESSNINSKHNGKLEISRVSKLVRFGIIAVLIIAMSISMVLCINTTMDLGNTKINREADSYEFQLSNWIARQKSILSMFVNIISAHPETMSDYNSAVNFLNDLAQNYPEISVCYMTNPTAEYPVIMNNGWQGPPGWKVEERLWYIDTQKSVTGFNISAPYYDAQTGFYCVTLSQVVYGKNGEFLGIFGIDFFLDKLIHILDESYTKDSYAFLVDKDGIIINHPNRLYQMKTEGGTNIADTEYADVYFESEVFTLEDYSSASVACLAKKNAESNFTVIVANSWWNIYGNIATLGGLFILLLVICIFSVITLINRQLRWQAMANHELKEAADEANRANQAKFQFLAQMSHEIRTPMNAVLGMNELILRESTDKNTLEYAENIQSAGKTLLSLINTILDFSKLDSGKMQIVPVRYDTTTMIDELLTMANERAKKKGLDFSVEIDPQFPKTMYGDDMRIKQVITNILTNAIKYTPQGAVKLEISVNYFDKDETVEFNVAVSDTGIGIREEDIGKLFQSFQRLDEEKNRNIEGTGLGIAIVQKLLVMMGSTLKVESIYGQGSTFSFNLAQKVLDKTPIGNYKEHNVIGKVSADKKNKQYMKFPGAKILVVDDNQMNLKVIRGIMKFNEIAPDLAESGAECLELAAANHYQIIFLDHMMPEMDGIETLKKLKAEHLTENCTIIALTANAISGAQKFYIDAGFDDYLSKPVNPDELERTLYKYLPKENPSAKTEIQAEENIIEEEPLEESGDNLTRKEIELLNKICPKINLDAAMSYCMHSREFFIEMMQEFFTDDKTENINAAYAAEDWKNYRIMVHALKSTSMVIGALKFSDQAKAQEFAAKDERIDDLKKNHADLMSDYNKLRAEIMQWLEVSGNAKNTDS